MTTAQLAWSAVSSSEHDITNPGTDHNLYLHLTSNVTSFKGAEIDLKWSPPGDPEAGCLVHTGSSFRTSSGTTCTYLNRGLSVPVTTVDEPGHLHLAWANSEAFTACTQGVALQLSFEFDGCADPTAVFQICSLSLVLADNSADTLLATNLGQPATVLSGGSYSVSCGESFALASLPDTTISPNQSLTLHPTIEGEAEGGATFEASALPDGAILDPVSGTVSWMPTLEQGGHVFPLTITAEDGAGQSSSTSLLVNVTQLPIELAAPVSPPWGTQMDVAESLYTSGIIGADTLQYLQTTWSYTDLKPLVDANYMSKGDKAVTDFGNAGIDLVFNIIRQTDPAITINGSHKPAAGADSIAWDATVTGMVNHFKIVGIHYWHIEEESTFWGDSDATYVAYLNHLVDLIHAADATSKVISMGLTSDQWYVAAKNAIVYLRRAPDSWLIHGSVAAWVNRASLILNTGHQDIVDAHSYETAPVLTGKIAYLRSLMTARPNQPIWCMEAGGPFETVQQGYSDSLGAYFVIWNFAEALASGLPRYTRVYKSIGVNAGATEAEMNIAMADAVAEPGKRPAYEAYRLMTTKLKGFTSVTDVGHHDGATEDADLYNYQFAVPSAKWGYVNVVWCPTLGFRKIVTWSNCGSLGTNDMGHHTYYCDTTYVTHTIRTAGIRAENAKVDTLLHCTSSPSPPVCLGDSLLLEREPYFIEAPAKFASGAFSTVGIDDPSSAASYADLSVSPSIARRTLRLRWSAPKSGIIGTCQIVSVTGRVVRRFEMRLSGHAEKGSLAWNLRDDRGATIPAGIYFVQLDLGAGMRATQRIAIIR